MEYKERESFRAAVAAVSQLSSLHLVSMVGHLATLNGMLIALEAPVVSNYAGNDANVEFL